MDKRPIRRKYNDNPYTLESIEKKEIYIIKFKDIKGQLHSINVDKDVFDVFDESERYENARLYEYSKHILFNPINDEVTPSSYSLEDEFINKIDIDILRLALDELPDIQKIRIKKYYFDNKTFDEIAREERCSKVAIKYSIDTAIKKISKKFQF